MGGAWLATFLMMKGPVIALLCLPAIAGCVMLLVIPHDGQHNGALLAGYYIVSCSGFIGLEYTLTGFQVSVYPGISMLIVLLCARCNLTRDTAPLIYSWSAANTAGETKKKIVNGIVLVGQCAGNVGFALESTTWPLC